MAATSPHSNHQSRSRTRRFTLFPTGPLGPPRPTSQIVSQDENSDRPVRSESSLFYPGSPASPIHEAAHGMTFPEVVQKVMEREHSGPSESAENGVHQRVPHVQSHGQKLWNQFDSHSKALEKDLQTFQDAVHVLGSSSDLARAARTMRKCLSLTAWLVQENARKLFPLAVKPSEPPHMDAEHISEPGHRPPWPPTSASQFNIDHPHISMRPIHAELKALADSVGNLRGELEQFSEFDDFGIRPLSCFEGDLKYWSSCLERYEGQFDLHEVQVYVHDLSVELGKKFEDIGRYVKQYIACVPTVRLSQKHAMSNLQTMATIATFFSAVTATTIQYSISPEPGIGSPAANAFWFSSLVFNIASALNSSLALMWRTAIYSSPQHRIPSWLWLWIRQCPTLFLLISVVTFLVGLGCFAVASQPHHIWIIVLICEAVSSFSLAALLVWLAADKWRLQLQRRSPGLRLSQILGRKTGNVLPTHVEHTASWSVGYLHRVARALSPVTAHFKFSWLRPSAPGFTLKRLSGSSTPESTPQPRSVIPRRSSSLPSAQQRWRRAIKKVILISKATHADKVWDRLEAERMTNLQDYLRKIAGEEVIRHEAGTATSGLQFNNPEGSSLAVCGKRLSMRCELGSSKKDHVQLRHYTGQARQVIWTTSGEYMLTLTKRAVHVWPLSGDLERKMIVRYETSSFILGIPTMKPNIPPRFISVEGSSKNKLALVDVRGEEHMNIEFEDISIQHVDVVPEGSCLLLAAEVSQSLDGSKPMSASPTRKLMVFNLESREVEHQVPLWHNIQNVTISGNGQMAVVTYEEYPPPQLWRLRRTPGGIRLSLERQFCARELASAHAFDPMKHIQFSGKGHFLHQDRFILCATTEGKIHFWRRDRAEPVHVLEGLTEDKDKPVQVVCNRSSDDFMFATRSQDGTVRIWKARDAPPEVLRVNTAGFKLSSIMESSSPHMLSESPLTQVPEEPDADAEGDEGGSTPQQQTIL